MVKSSLTLIRWGQEHEKDALKKLEQILGVQVLTRMMMKMMTMIMLMMMMMMTIMIMSIDQLTNHPITNDVGDDICIVTEIMNC